MEMGISLGSSGMELVNFEIFFMTHETTPFLKNISVRPMPSLQAMASVYYLSIIR